MFWEEAALNCVSPKHLFVASKLSALVKGNGCIEVTLLSLDSAVSDSLFLCSHLLNLQQHHLDILVATMKATKAITTGKTLVSNLRQRAKVFVCFLKKYHIVLGKLEGKNPALSHEICYTAS